MTTELINEPVTLEALVKRSAYTKRFEEVLGKKAPGFMSSLITVGRMLPDVDPKSIMGAAMKAAVLDLPIDPSLGFAWIVAYREGDKKIAQFQIGYKGFIQLALRSGYYRRMNARPVNAEAFIGYDEVGEPKIDWDKIDPEKEPSGYVFAFQLINGFSKVCYWSKERVLAHARRFSQAYKKGYGPWKDYPEAMSLKTVIKNEISDWGILSIEFRMGMESDQAAFRGPDALPEYIDSGEFLNLPEKQAAVTEEKTVPKTEPEKPAPALPRNPDNIPTEREAVAMLTPQEQLAHFITKECGQTFTVFQKWAMESGVIPDADALSSFEDVPDKFCKRVLNAKVGVTQGMTKTVLGQ